MTEYPTAEATEPRRDRPTDPAHADDAHHQTAELSSSLDTPVTGANPPVTDREVTEGTEHQRQSMISDRRGVGSGAVGHHDAQGSGCRQVDGVDSHAIAREDAQVGRSVQMGRRDRAGARDPADSLSEHRGEPGQSMLMITKGHGESRCPQLCDEIELT
jgi:hypothetical protein